MSLSTRILRVLDTSPVPLPTPELIARCGDGSRCARDKVWGVLRRLEAGGLVVRQVVRNECRSHKAKAKAVCAACGEGPKSIWCRGICYRCYVTPGCRPSGPRAVYTVALWSVAKGCGVS